MVLPRTEHNAKRGLVSAALGVSAGRFASILALPAHSLREGKFTLMGSKEKAVGARLRRHVRSS